MRAAGGKPAASGKPGADPAHDDTDTPESKHGG
jgi:hypothetical protein